MALIKCPECGKEISDKAAACPNCGCPISSETTNPVATDRSNYGSDSVNPEQKKKKSKLPLILIIIAIIVLAAACILGWVFLLPELKYQKAMKLYDDGDMTHAYDEFASIQDYKDSSLLMEYCIFNQGTAKYRAGDYEGAISFFKQCKSMEDAGIMVDRCNYGLAEKAFSNGDYDLALTLISDNDSSGCKELRDMCNYQLAEKAFTEGNYASAIELLTDNTYSESETLLKKCKVEKEKHEKSDYAFLSDLEQSILRRMEINAKEQHDYDQLVGTELAYVEKYYNASFYDANLKKLAKKYIDGLKKQKDALSEFYYWDYQDKWYNGLVERYEVLNELHTKYDFLKDDKNFIGEYVYKLDYWQKWLKAFNELEAMFGKQYAGEFWKTDHKYFYLTFTNTTKYTFTNQMDVWIYNLDGDKLLDTRTYVTKDIHPGDTFTIEIYVGEYDGCQIKDFGNWYPDIQIP